MFWFAETELPFMVMHVLFLKIRVVWAQHTWWFITFTRRQNISDNIYQQRIKLQYSLASRWLNATFNVDFTVLHTYSIFSLYSSESVIIMWGRFIQKLNKFWVFISCINAVLLSPEFSILGVLLLLMLTCMLFVRNPCYLYTRLATR